MDNTVISNYVNLPSIATCDTTCGYTITRDTGTSIKLDDIVTWSDLKENLSLLYEHIYNYFCNHDETNKEKYEMLLKLNDFDFRRTVLQIELSKQEKSE